MSLLKLAEECGGNLWRKRSRLYVIGPESLARFAARVRAEERERIAEAFERRDDKRLFFGEMLYGDQVANIIRALPEEPQ